MIPEGDDGLQPGQRAVGSQQRGQARGVRLAGQPARRPALRQRPQRQQQRQRQPAQLLRTTRTQLSSLSLLYPKVITSNI